MTKSFVRIKAGAYRTTDVSGMTFELVDQYKKTAKGGYVTVKNAGTFPGFPDEIRIKVDSVASYEFVASDAVEAQVVVQHEHETDEQAIDRKSTRLNSSH